MKTVDVSTGKLKIGKGDTILISNAIGSCVVLSTYDPLIKIGAMAHIMLPGSAPNISNISKLKYANNAIEIMLTTLSNLGLDHSTLPFCLVGGANVLQKKDDSICRNNINSVLDIINKHKLILVAQETGGILRRTCRLSISTGKFYFTEGNSNEILLFDAKLQG